MTSRTQGRGLTIDQAARLKALDLTQSFIVQAPAGSGKTALLIQRFLKALSHVTHEPEEVLALTFTRKAAFEMRSRICDALKQATDPKPLSEHEGLTWELARQVLARDQAHGWQLLANPKRLRILTIDALSATLASQMPLLSQMAQGATVLEEASALYDLAATRVLGGLEERLPWSQHLESLLQHLDNDLELLKRLLSELLPKREQWLPFFASTMQAEEFKAVLESGLEALSLTALEALVKCLPASEREALRLIAQTCLQNIPDTPVALLDSSCKPLNEQLSQLPLWRFCSNMLLTTEGQWRISFGQAQGFRALSASQDPDDKADFKAHKAKMKAWLGGNQLRKDLLGHLQRVKRLPSACYDERQWSMVHALSELLPIASAELLVLFQEKRQVDFAQIAISACQALGELENPSDLALVLDYRWRHILIDEFQDTSLAQGRLLELLTQGWQPDEGRSLFVVGDPMQSIYRFRQAEVGLFLKAQAQGLHNIALTPLYLRQNFRTDKRIIEWLSGILSQSFPSQNDISNGAIRFEPAISALPALDNVRVALNLQASPDAQQEAEAIAYEIATIRAQNPTDSLAILVRSRRHLSALLPTLKLRKIPYNGLNLELLFDCPVVQDLLSLTRALRSLNDRTSWLSLLRSPCCGLSLADLHVLSENAPDKPLWTALENFQTLPLSAYALNQLQHFVPMIQKALHERARASIDVWISELWEQLGGEALLRETHERLAVDAYFELLQKCATHSGLFDLQDFIKKLRQLYAPNLPSSENPVQIMTIHKAKGLEFDTVIMPGLGRRGVPDPEQLLLWQTRPGKKHDHLIIAPIKKLGEKSDPMYDYLKVEQSFASQQEALRVFYVGSTRARKRLLLYGHLKNGHQELPQTGSFLALLWDALPAELRKPTLSQPATTPDTEPGSSLLRRLNLSFLSERQSLTPVRLGSSLSLSKNIHKMKPHKLKVWDDFFTSLFYKLARTKDFEAFELKTRSESYLEQILSQNAQDMKLKDLQNCFREFWRSTFCAQLHQCEFLQFRSTIVFQADEQNHYPYDLRLKIDTQVYLVFIRSYHPLESRGLWLEDERYLNALSARIQDSAETDLKVSLYLPQTGQWLIF